MIFLFSQALSHKEEDEATNYDQENLGHLHRRSTFELIDKLSNGDPDRHSPLRRNETL